jgi:hypothetical protein
VANIGFSSAADAERPLIGFVELPTIFGQSDPHGPPGQVPPDTLVEVPLHSQPTFGSPVIGRITDPVTVEAKEFGYEERAAAVYGVSDGWTLVRLDVQSDQEFGWVAPENSGDFHVLEERIANGLSYLTPEWSGQLYDEPSGSAFAVASQDELGLTPHINVIKISGTGNDAWLYVEILKPGRCLQPEEPGVVATGWVKVHSPDGSPNAWFDARGC